MGSDDKLGLLIREIRPQGYQRPRLTSAPTHSALQPPARVLLPPVLTFWPQSSFELMPQAADLRYEESADTLMDFKGARQYAETSLSCCGWGLGWAGLTARGLWNWQCIGRHCGEIAAGGKTERRLGVD